MKLIQSTALFFVLLLLPVYTNIFLLIGLSTSKTTQSAIVAPIILQNPQNVSKALMNLCINQSICFNHSEISHLQDVATVINTIRYLTLISIILLFLIKAPSTLHNQVKAILFLYLSLIPIIILFWHSFFTTFHQFLFPGGNWAFPSDSLLIQLYPDSFWFKSAILFLLLLVFEYLLLFHYSKKTVY